MFGARPDGTSIVSCCQASPDVVLATLVEWGGRFSKLKVKSESDWRTSFPEFRVAGNEHILCSNGTWTSHFDNSFTISTGMAISVSRIAKSIGVRFTITTADVEYPCVRMEYYTMAGLRSGQQSELFQR